MILTETRRDTYLPLTECGVPEAIQERLAALGIVTLEELRDYWTYGNRQLLVDYLGDSPVRFVAYKPPAGLTRGAAASGPGASLNLLAAGRTPPLVRHPRGVALAPAQRRRKAGEPEPLPAAKSSTEPGPVVSLAAKFPRVRDQGQRGTCVAFATVAYLEYHLTGATEAAKANQHAEQFVYWACKEDDGSPDEEGTHVHVVQEVLKKRGACLARTWRYEMLPVGPTEGQGPPPDGAEAEAAKYTWGAARKLAAGNVERLRESLDQGRPLVLSVLTFPSWDYPSAEETGEITMPLPQAQPDGAHAVCVVGYELRNRVPGGGVFIFRNSWGEKWARRQGRFGGGYGTLFFNYVSQYALEAFG